MNILIGDWLPFHFRNEYVRNQAFVLMAISFDQPYITPYKLYLNFYI